MSEMVERVALALTRASPAFIDATAPLAYCRSLAILVIETMREPTMAMCVAADEKCGPVWNDSVVPPTLGPRFAVTGAEWWKAMIDEALKDQCGP